MSDLRTAAQQALETLQNVITAHGYEGGAPLRARDALCAALAEPVQEPVAWMVYTLDGKSVCVTDNPADFGPEHKALPLYTAPPQRKPLTEEEIRRIYDTHRASVPLYHAIARAIERAHGIGGDA